MQGKHVQHIHCKHFKEQSYTDYSNSSPIIKNSNLSNAVLFSKRTQNACCQLSAFNIGMCLFLCSLLVAAIVSQSGVFEGPSDSLVFTHSMKLLMDGTYRTMGRLLALSLTQGGPGLHCMAEAAYRYWSGLSVSDDLLAVELVTDVDMRSKIQSVRFVMKFVHMHAPL